MRRVERTSYICEHCGKGFVRLSSQTIAYKHTYCSQRCHYDDIKRVGNGQSKKEDRICIICGSTFTVVPSSKQKMCSVECRAIHSKTVISETRKKRIITPCPVCGNPVSRRLNRVISGKDKYCSKQCSLVAVHNYHASFKPKNWKGGKATKNARKVIYQQLRRDRIKEVGGSLNMDEWENIKKEFDYKCLSCGKREPEILLTIDHRMPIIFGGPHEAANIQPLCMRCNAKKHTKAIYYYPNGLKVDFMKLIKYVADHEEYKHLIKFNTTAINNLARSIKGKSPVPGIEFVEE